MMQRSQQLAAIDPRMQAMSTILRGNDGEGEDGGLDLLKYWHIIVKRKWTVLSVFIIVLLTGMMMTMLTTPQFRASATLQIERQSQRVVSVPGVDAVENPYDYEFYETQFQLLRSRSMSEKVAADLDPEDPVFAVMGAPSPLGKLMQLVLDRKSRTPTRWTSSNAAGSWRRWCAAVCRSSRYRSRAWCASTSTAPTRRCRRRLPTPLPPVSSNPTWNGASTTAPMRASFSKIAWNRSS
ncbi:MAG: hypothetical protein IPO66_04300 [Rhodanobacteraceae bacterium]|nr:hypothetical protein [Rhodanobacteraceae bacterium]